VFLIGLKAVVSPAISGVGLAQETGALGGVERLGVGSLA
jgi:hypothetical protein